MIVSASRNTFASYANEIWLPGAIFACIPHPQIFIWQGPSVKSQVALRSSYRSHHDDSVSKTRFQWTGRTKSESDRFSICGAGLWREND